MNKPGHIDARAAKIIHRLPLEILDQDTLETSEWEPLSNQYKKKLLILMYKVNSNITPDKITNLFSIATSISEIVILFYFDIDRTQDVEAH